MSELKWELVDTVFGRLEAEALAAFLEAEDIPVELFQEGIGHHGYVVTTGSFGKVQLFVPKEKAERARELLEAYYSGALADDMDVDMPESFEDDVD